MNVSEARADLRSREAMATAREVEFIDGLCISCISEGSEVDPTFPAEVFEGEVISACPRCGSESVVRA